MLLINKVTKKYGSFTALEEITLSQEELAEQLGVSRQAVSRYHRERNVNLMSLRE